MYFVALDNQLHAHDRNNGARRWKKSLGYRPSSGPSIVGRTVSAPGREAKLQAFDTVTGAPGAQLTLPATMVEPPVLFPSVNGGPVRVAALGGGLENIWKLTAAWPPPPPVPDLKTVPLTELPGRVVPLEPPRAPLE